MTPRERGTEPEEPGGARGPSRGGIEAPGSREPSLGGSQAPGSREPSADAGSASVPDAQASAGSLASLPERKRDALNRIRTAIGHARAVERMVEEDRYCIDVLKQLAAVQAQLGKVAHLVTRSHMELCLRHAIEEGEGQAHIDELAEALRYLGATRADSG